MWQIRFCIQVLEHAMKREWNATNGADARGDNSDSRLEKKSPDFVSRFLYAQRMGRVQEETAGYRQNRRRKQTLVSQRDIAYLFRKHVNQRLLSSIRN